eukprot:TRINITY_DN14680_c0_g1_i2.p1 TRINITY_DN14680_c0_g1~~TRINITY_DN14680_c0_g1_i2.p1  ORF type:complete len:154 (-),score=35.29 TRINITY_DN14680_c0_g1_i2:74-535(-)
MTLLWTAIYGLLCAEVGVITLLLLPYISTHFWCRIVFRTKWMYEWLDNLLGITWYFWVLVGLLGFVFMNCLYELTKYTAVQDSHKENTVDAVSRQLDSINVFRAQRNVYIAGLTMFLALVLKRVLSLILKLGKVRTQREDLKKNSAVETKKDD